MKPLDNITNSFIRKDMPSFDVGDTVNIEVKIIEGGKEKSQGFKGVVLARRGSGLDETFVVRKISYGEGVERTFYLNSPRVNKIEVIKKGRVRRAKLYYLRERKGKRAKVKDLIGATGREAQEKTQEESVTDNVKKAEE